MLTRECIWRRAVCVMLGINANIIVRVQLLQRWQSCQLSQCAAALGGTLQHLPLN